jgi:hypothetical protein
MEREFIERRVACANFGCTECQRVLLLETEVPLVATLNAAERKTFEERKAC